MAQMIDYVMSNTYLSSLAIFLGFFIVSRIFVWIVEKVVIAITKKTKTDIDDKLVHQTNNPISVLLVLIGLKIAEERINAANQFSPAFEKDFFYVTDRILASLIIFIFSIILIRVVKILINHYGARIVKRTKSDIDDQLLGVFNKSVQILLFFVSSLYILSQWGIDITPYLASLGIAGIAIGFAVQDTLKNIFGGFALIMDQNIRVGDKIMLEAGQVGVVHEIGLRSTKMKTFDNEMVIVPNGLLANQRVHNYALPTPQNRVVIPFSVAYGVDVEDVRKVVLKTVGTIKDVIKEGDNAPRVDFLKMGSSSLEFQATFWVNDYKGTYDAKIEGTTRIYNALRKSKIEIPFPQLDVHIRSRE